MAHLACARLTAHQAQRAHRWASSARWDLSIISPPNLGSAPRNPRRRSPAATVQIAPRERLLTKRSPCGAAPEAIPSDHSTLWLPPFPPPPAPLPRSPALPLRWRRWGAGRQTARGASRGGGGGGGRGRGRGRWGTAMRPPRVCWRSGSKGRRPSRSRRRPRPGGGEAARWLPSPRSRGRDPPAARCCRRRWDRPALGTTARRRHSSTRSWPTPKPAATAPSGTEVLPSPSLFLS